METAEAAPPALEAPEPAASRMVRLRSRLAKSGSLGAALLSVLSRDSLSEEDWEEIEETLLVADVGSEPTDELLDKLRTQVRVSGASNIEQVRAELRTIPSTSSARTWTAGSRPHRSWVTTANPTRRRS